MAATAVPGRVRGCGLAKGGKCPVEGALAGDAGGIGSVAEEACGYGGFGGGRWLGICAQRGVG